MLDKVRELITKENLIKYGDHIVIGLSGGADSVCLFRVLVSLREEYNLTLYAVHVNHGIRGKEADDDEAFSAALAESFGVEFRSFHYPVKELAVQWKMTEEEAGRTVRYRVFEEMKREKNADSIAVAHHQNDQAETVLFRMCRGTGMRGMRGILAKRDDIIRPLLCVSRDEIEDYLEDISQEYCSDHTNEDTDYNRNRIRNLILPELENINDRVVEHIYEMTVQVKDIYEWFESECDRYFDQYVEEEENGLRIKAESLLELPKPVKSEIIRKMIGSLTRSLKDIENRHITGIYDLTGMESGKSIRLPYELGACREYEYIRIYKNIAAGNNPINPHIIDMGLENDEYTSKLIDEFKKSRDLYDKYPTKENTINLSKIKKELYSNNLYKDYINKLKVYNTEIERIEKEIDNALYSKELKNLLKSRCIHD